MSSFVEVCSLDETKRLSCRNGHLSIEVQVAPRRWQVFDLPIFVSPRLMAISNCGHFFTFVDDDHTLYVCAFGEHGFREVGRQPEFDESAVAALEWDDYYGGVLAIYPYRNRRRYVSVWHLAQAA